MKSPFANNKSSDEEDKKLISEALSGNRKSLEKLMQNHQSFIYNIAWKMVLNPADAEDITQDILIKVITNLSGFRGESQFRTWLYRIVVNHILTLKKFKSEENITTFENYGEVLDNITNSNYPERGGPSAEDQMVIEDVKLGCTAGMLICLDREQRIIYILGEIFGTDHNLGSEILNISKDNYRQKLSRSRKNLYSFMKEKCGLVNKNNPCRCSKKTRGFIEAGYVNPNHLQFNAKYIKKIYEVIGDKCISMGNVIDKKYTEIFRTHPLQEHDFVKEKLSEILQDQEIQKAFNL